LLVDGTYNGNTVVVNVSSLVELLLELGVLTLRPREKLLVFQ